MTHLTRFRMIEDGARLIYAASQGIPQINNGCHMREMVEHLEYYARELLPYVKEELPPSELQLMCVEVHVYGTYSSF